MKIGDKVSFIDEVYNKRRYGIIQKFNADGTKAVVNVTKKFTRAWMQLDKLELLKED
jgi:hypothetical protein